MYWGYSYAVSDAEDFMDYVNSMESNQPDARTINANAIDQFFASILSICTDPTKAVSAIAYSNASVQAAEDAIYNASLDAKQAFYCYRRFIEIANPLSL